MRFEGKNSNAFNYISSKYVFRFNVVTNFYEFAVKRKKNKNLKWIRYNDRHKNSILLELMQEHIEVATDKFNIFVESEACSPDYDPFNEYFENLKPYNKKKEKDYIDLFAKTINTDDSKRFKKTLERFLVGTLDCLLKRNSVNDVCMVFQSKQGRGKTRWMRTLLPKVFQDEYLYEGSIDTRNKDHNIYLSQYWFIHLDELEALKGNAIESIKSYITRGKINERKAYGRYSTYFERRASFLGSVNADKFLSDMTGNRRWLVFRVKSIDYMHGLDSDRLWAQVFALHAKGYRHWFNPEEIKELNEENEKFREVSLEEEMIIRFFEFPKWKTSKGEYTSGSEALQKIIFNVPGFNNKLTSYRINKALSKHSELKKMKGKVQRYYLEYMGADLEVDSPSVTFNSGKKSSKSIDEDDDLPF